MPRPPRRRRFFARREGEFHTRISKESPALFDPASSQSLPPSGSVEDDVSAPLDEQPPEGPEEEMAALEAESPETASDVQWLLGRRPRPGKRRRLSLGWVVLLLLTCSLLAAFGGYLLAKPTRKAIVLSAPRVVQENVEPIKPTEQEELDEAFKVRHQRQFADAEQRFAALASEGWNHGAMELEIGRTLLYQGKLSDAKAVLETAASKGPMAADANFLLGALYKTQKSYPQAETSFATAVTLDPTRPEFYYVWGECLREEGKLLEAASRFRSALVRNEYETATGLYRVKLWLCEIEANREDADGISAEIDAALTRRYPPMEAFFASAARELKAGHTEAAVAQIRRARRRTDATVFAIIIGDPLFSKIRANPEWK